MTPTGLVLAACLLAACAAAAALSGCQPVAVNAHNPSASATTMQEPGFSAFCAAHPGRGTCP